MRVAIGAFVVASIVGGCSPLRPPKPDLSVGLTMHEVRQTMEYEYDDAKICLEPVLKNEKIDQGKVTVAFEIQGNGHPKNVKVVHSKNVTTTAKKCLVEAIQSWRFVPPRGGVIVKVTFPYVLKRAS